MRALATHTHCRQVFGSVQLLFWIAFGLWIVTGAYTVEHLLPVRSFRVRGVSCGPYSTWSAAAAAAAALAATSAEHRSAAPCQGLELGSWQVLLGFVIALWALKPKRQWTDCIGKVDMPEWCRQFRYPLMHAGAPLVETSQCTPACFVFGRTRVEGKLVELKDGPTFYKSAAAESPPRPTRSHDTLSTPKAVGGAGVH